ncbi:MAG: hypothetical protein K6G16_08535 [Lachnospiraceae bacterium]|nr:hypothetical protein [Lachnospiraceae bacterium]
MSRGVTIKGTGKGVILVLDARRSFEELRGELGAQIRASSHFYANAAFQLTVRGRDLTEEEQEELIAIVQENAGVTVTELTVEAPVEPKHLSAAEIFADSGESEESVEPARVIGGDTEELSAVDRAILRELEKQMSGEFAVMHAGPVHNGETIRSEYSLIIMGDVRAGGRVEANGSIFVMGNLYGEAVAGAEGNRSAIVASSNLRPQSLSIGSLTGYRVPARLRRRPFGKKRLMEAACVKNGEIVRMAYCDFIADNLLA